jgi:proton-dependent oligopeptide transporter, POT family
LSLSQRLSEIRTGFERPFWVANVTEMFERLSYYAVFSSLSVYLNESLKFSTEQAGSLSGFFGGFVWFMAIFGGALADRMGFRRALSLAYLILATAYFLLGSINAAWMAPLRGSGPPTTLVLLILALPALGVALVKPIIVGTTARSSQQNVRSIGYSIYYTMVNIGSLLGPMVAGRMKEMKLPDEYIFLVAAVSVFLMFFAVMLFFKEPAQSAQTSTSLAQTLRNFGTVVSNFRFMLFLLIFSGYWIVFWQEFIILPLYVRDFIDKNANTQYILSWGPGVVITLTVVANYLTRRIPALPAIALGTLITSLAWVIVALQPTVTMAVFTVIVVALGEIIQSPRYYEYISRLAPEGQQGTYMGFAFLPIGIGSLVAGKLGGGLYHYYGEVQKRPEMIWWVVTGIGVVTAVLLFIYDRMFAPKGGDDPAAKAA